MHSILEIPILNSGYWPCKKYLKILIIAWLTLVIPTRLAASALTRNEAQIIVTFSHGRSWPVIFLSCSTRCIALTRWFIPPTQPDNLMTLFPWQLLICFCGDECDLRVTCNRIVLFFYYDHRSGKCKCYIDVKLSKQFDWLVCWWLVQSHRPWPQRTRPVCTTPSITECSTWKGRSLRTS